MHRLGRCLIILVFFIAPRLAFATVYYVATNGNDSYNGLYPAYQGGSKGPFRTLSHAAGMVRPGDTVKIRGGTYREASSWRTDGTQANPITITNYNGETPVIDGANFTIPGPAYSILLTINGDWNCVSNLEIHHSSWYGLFIYGENCIIDNIYSYQNWGSGINCSGSYGLIKNCRVWNNSLQNEFFQPHYPGTWSSGIAVSRGTPQVHHTTIRNCIAWDTWGQGIDVYEATYCTVEDCISYDNQQNFYISDAQHILFQRNLAYCTPGNIIQAYVTQNNILMGDEKLFNSSDNILINNLCLGGERNIFIGKNVLENCLIANNTFVNASNTAGSESACVSINSGSYTNARFLNNIVLQEDSVRIAANGATGIFFGTNNWSKTPPSSCQGTGDITANPLLARTGPTAPGWLTPAWFKIVENSPARDRAAVLSQLTEDFFRTPRGGAPDMGGHEFTAASSPLVASASGSPAEGPPPLEVNFTGRASGGIPPYSYRWNFGDGGASSSQNPAYTYTSAGSYTATFTVTDSGSERAHASVTITVGSTDLTVSLSLAAQTGAPAPGQGGTTDPSPGTYIFSVGSTVLASSIANAEYRFSKWEGEIAPSGAFDSDISVVMDGDKSLTSIFCAKCADVNGDLSITPADAQRAFDIYLGRISNPTWCERENADVNASGTKESPEVTPADAQMIFKKYLKKGIADSNCSGNSRRATVSFRNTTIAAAGTLMAQSSASPQTGDIYVAIIVDSPSEIEAFGLDLVFSPSQLTYIGLERTELTSDFSPLDAHVITSPQRPVEGNTFGGNDRLLRVGGFKPQPTGNPSSGVLMTLIFRPNGVFQAATPVSIIAAYDDLQNAAVLGEATRPQIGRGGRQAERPSASEKVSPGKRHGF